MENIKDEKLMIEGTLQPDGKFVKETYKNIDYPSLCLLAADVTAKLELMGLLTKKTAEKVMDELKEVY